MVSRVSIYILNLAVIGTLALLIGHVRNINKDAAFRLGLIYLFVISSLRSRWIGTDYHVYVDIFYNVAAGGGSYMEKGYVLLNRIVALFTDNYIGLAAAVNMLLFVPLYFYIKKTVDKHWWGFCLFVFAINPYMYVQSTFNILRQACATGFVLIGINVLINSRRTVRSVLIFYLMILIGAQLHTSAYLMGIIPIVLSIRWKKAYWYVVVIAAIVFNQVGLRALMAFIAGRLNFPMRYLNVDASMLNNPIYVLFIVLFIIFLLSHYDAYSEMGGTEKRIIDLYLSSLCFLIMALPNDVIFRVYIMLAYCALPGVPLVCQSTKIGVSRIRIRFEDLFVQRLYILYYVAFYIGYISLLAMRDNKAYIPFRFYFQ